LEFKKGWPRETGINRFYLPASPVFGDIDGDTALECVISSWDLSSGYLYAWHADWTPYNGDTASSGLFATAPDPSMFNMPLIADIDGNGGAEIVASALPDAWMTVEKQTILAWDKEAQILPDWPLTVENSPEILKDYANTPVIGDLNGDGNVDLAMTTALGDLVFVNFSGIPYSESKSYSPMWRYNRRLNNCGKWTFITTDVPGHEYDRSTPENFTLYQNYPNPFNATTSISYSLSKPEDVVLEIFNLLGQKVIMETLGRQSPGLHRFDWEAVDSETLPLPSGVYFYRLKVGSGTITRKMLLLK
jgi:hypothetical protein